jgi:hypothetical protein
MFMNLVSNDSRKILSEYFLALILLLPMLVLNLINGQHWGDDFAQYILQAKNIASGLPHDTTGFIFNELNQTYAPPVYPPGFPLLLSPVIKFFGDNILTLNYFMSGLFIVWGLLCFTFFRRYFSFAISICIVLIALYPNFFMWLKASVLSDIPFSLLFLTILLLLNNRAGRNYKKVIVSGTLTGFLMTIRNPGFILIVAFAAELFWDVLVQFKKTRKIFFDKQHHIYLGIYAVLTLTTFWLITFVWFPSKVEHFNHYSGLLHGKSILSLITENTLIYITHFMELFRSTAPSLKGASEIFSIIILLMLISGWIYKWLKGPELTDWAVLIYTILIIVYPVSTQGYRFLAPIHPVYMLYVFSLFSIDIFQKSKVQLPVVVAITTLCMIFYFDHLKYVFQHRNDVVDGPYEEICQETFAYIRENVSENDVIVFTKPRALTLYTDKRTTIYSWEHSPEENVNQLKKLGATYYLHTWKLNESEYVKLLEFYEPGLEKVYENWQFKLYKERR